MTSKIAKHVETVVTQFCERVSIHFNIDKDMLMDMWENQTVVSRANVDNAVKYCNHQFTKGQRVGMICKQKISDSETKCSKHRVKKKTVVADEVAQEESTNQSVQLEQQFNNLTFSLDHSDSSDNND